MLIHSITSFDEGMKQSVSAGDKIWYPARWKTRPCKKHKLIALSYVVSNHCLCFTCIWQEEEDDYESPDEEQEQDADYESPTDEPGHDSDDYEPPPSNNDVAPHNVIFPAKSIPSNTEYIGNWCKM